MLALLAGFAGLGAEVVYLKALDFAVGSAPFVRLTVVATFIVGMGAGSLWSSRVRRPWLAEVLAAGWAVVWLLGFDAIVAGSGRAVAGLTPALGTNAASAVVGFGHLLVPSLALGVALPAIIESEGRLDRVYAHHALGALLGIALFETVVYPTFGLPGGWLLIAVTHAAVVWLWLERRQRRPMARVRLGRLSGELFATGVATGGTQGAWLLVGALLFRPFYFVAPSVIGAFILGQALGALVWTRTRHGFAAALKWAALGTAISATLAALWVYIPRPDSPGIGALQLALIIAPAAVPIGTLYPAWLRDKGVERTQTGGALLSLSVGNAVGAFVGGGLLLAWLPPIWVLVVLTGGLALLLLRTERPPAAAVAIAAAAVAAAFTPDAAFFRGRDGHARRVRAELVLRGPGELTAIYSHATLTDRERRLYQTGYSPVNLEPEVGLKAESSVGAFGVLHAPRLATAMVLGAGSGRTAGFVAQAFEHTDVIDIGATVPAVLHYLRDLNYGLLDNDRARYHAIDGALAPAVFESGSYDLIVHTLHPGYVDRAAKLYTEEYLVALARLLRDDGVLVTWADVSISPEANRIYQQTISAVFPHTSLFAVRSKRWDYSYYVTVAGLQPPVPHEDRFARTALADTLDLARVPLRDRRLPALPRGGRTHRIDSPALAMLLGGYTVHELEACQGECSPGDTLRETQPCGPGRAHRRQKRRECTRECRWGSWSEWTECAP